MPESGVPREKTGVGQARATHPDEFWATPQASTGVTPNMMMLGL